MNQPLSTLPPDLPRPADDGAASHLPGIRLPELTLPATDGTDVDLATLTGRTVVYIYPMTGRPGVPLPDGWEAIPGARGCTPQSCGFRDHHAELQALNTRVFGLSTQTRAYQSEARDRLNLPFQLLSDPELRLGKAIGLPTFVASGQNLYKRMTLIIQDGTIVKVFYPVFPPDRSAEETLAWLRENG